MDQDVRARENIRNALVADRTFPARVFVSGWDGFRFFGDWHMRQSEFVELAKLLLDLDGGSRVCLMNVDGGTNREVTPAYLCIGRDATADTFAPATTGPVSWVTCMVALAASSDRGDWCMYCEPMAELGVIAFRTPELFERAAHVLARLHAQPPALCLAEPTSYVWAHASSNPEYFATLVREYTDDIEPVGA